MTFVLYKRLHPRKGVQRQRKINRIVKSEDALSSELMACVFLLVYNQELLSHHIIIVIPYSCIY